MYLPIKSNKDNLKNLHVSVLTNDVVKHASVVYCTLINIYMICVL